MTISYKILAQSAAAGSGSTSTLYTVPAATQTVISTLSICNPNSSNVTCNVYVVPNGGSITNASPLIGNAFVQNYDTLLLTLGVSLGTAGDTLQISANTADVAFNLFGSEVS